ncbi:MAG: ATPase [marine bacterium B5-7]|nr:MAG: ATPase [marine bacterium B5-7]
MAFVSGPRQVGKTTLALSIQSEKNTAYLNWDDIGDRELILKGGKSIAQHVGLEQLRENPILVVFDEIHKYPNWKQLLKGFYDRYKKDCQILVTGSARMDVFKKGGDSLMGRYFNYRLHPISVSELKERRYPSNEIRNPSKPNDNKYMDLYRWGGFPEPYLKKDQRFFNRWSRLREQQLLNEDIRDLTGVQQIGQMELLASLLKNQVGQLTSYSQLAKKVRVSVDTVRRWISILEAMYFCFSIRPWTKNVTRSLLKEPKYYLWDWAQCSDVGSRNENFIASHLLKSVHFWTDQGFGDYQLYFLRDKEKREVDFLVSKDGNPWFLVEVKSTMKESLSPNLERFGNQLSVKHIFQVALDGEYVDRDVFKMERPAIIPARTFLSQLV